MSSYRRFGLLLPFLLLAGCASPAEDDGAEQSGQASSAASCRPFLLDTSVDGRGVAVERLCTSADAADWALTYRTVVEETAVNARYVAQGPRKAELAKAIQRIAAEGVSIETATFFSETLEPALGALLKAEDDAAKATARQRVRELIEGHLLSLGT